MDDVIYRKLAEKGKLKQHTVRIETEYGCGTGFLYTMKGSTYVYIITVCHVVLKAFVKKSRKPVQIDYLSNSKEYELSQFELCTLYEDEKELEKLCGRLEDEDERASHDDIAVLRIKKKEISCGDMGALPVYRLSEEKIKRGINFTGYCFPNEKKNYEEIFGDCLRWEAENRLITCKARNIETIGFTERLRGFSGTGLVAEYEGSSVFAGILVACDINEMYQQFLAIGSTEISERLKSIGWETMEEYDEEEPPAGFCDEELLECHNTYLKSMDTDTKRLICKIIRQIARESSPEQMLAKEEFYDIPVCDGNRKNCNYYWSGRIWPMFIGKVLHDDICNVCYQPDMGEKLKVVYVCSEGNGEAELASVVGAAANGRVLGEQIPGNSILIWQSREIPRVKRSFPRRKFKKIINDIADGEMEKYKEFSSTAAYDLLEGEMKERDYGIIHIQELLDKLDDCQTEEEMKDKLEEILDDIWG